jgi:hypothetical protein
MESSKEVCGFGQDFKSLTRNTLLDGLTGDSGGVCTALASFSVGFSSSIFVGGGGTAFFNTEVGLTRRLEESEEFDNVLRGIVGLT